MAQRLRDRFDFNVLMLYNSFGSEPLKCPVDGKQYKKGGWFLRHMWRSGHWREGKYPEYSCREVKDPFGVQIMSKDQDNG